MSPFILFSESKCPVCRAEISRWRRLSIGCLIAVECSECHSYMRNSRAVCFTNVVSFILLFPGLSLIHAGRVLLGSCLLLVLVAVSVRLSLYTAPVVDPAHANRVEG